jgi:tetratricopeptide (TPR) repeat protein
VAYQLTPDLSALLAELQAHHPVEVLQNTGRAARPQWRFAVLIGYDAQSDTVLLRSGSKRRQVMTSRDFLSTWDRADRWALLVLRPGELPAFVNRDRYLEAAVEFGRDARPENSRLAFDVAVKTWPDEPGAWSGRGNAELHAGDLMAAARDYSMALRIDGSTADVRHDLAMTLLYLGCTHRAQSQIDRISLTGLSAEERLVVQNSRDRIAERQQSLILQEPATCAEFSF